MLSILIPCYNYNCFPLTYELHKQCSENGIDFEIICIDDGSHSSFNKINQQINQLQNASFSILEKNIGRSAIRNLLAKKAKYNLLLFFDSDTWPTNNHFMHRIIKNSNDADVIYGGVVSNQNIQDKKLRWVYRKLRECPTINERLKNPYYTFSSACFTIKKNTFNSIKFDESLTKYGCEDLLFAHQLKLKHIKIKHIDNSVFHKSTDEVNLFLTKTKHALENLKMLTNQNSLPKNIFRVSKLYYTLKKARLNLVISSFFKIIESYLIKKLNSNNPSIFFYDLYRLGYFCYLDKK